VSTTPTTLATPELKSYLAKKAAEALAAAKVPSNLTKLLRVSALHRYALLVGLHALAADEEASVEGDLWRLLP
jgi:hypothetical protein